MKYDCIFVHHIFYFRLREELLPNLPWHMRDNLFRKVV